MAGAVLDTRRWVANELPDFAAGDYHIKVSGEVEVGATTETPTLRAHVPQGFNPRVLLLDLIVTSHGAGIEIMNWKEVHFTRRTNGRQYDEVDILFAGVSIEHIKVRHPKTAGRTKKIAKKYERKPLAKNRRAAAKISVKTHKKKLAAKKSRAKKH